MKLFEGVYAYVWGKAFSDVSNTYIIKDRITVLIDPGRYKSFTNLYGLMKNDGIEIKDIEIVVNTHTHLDHCESISMFKRHGALLSFHRKENVFIKPDISINEVASEIGVEIIHTPGHSPGSITIYLPKYEAAISGDLIFENGSPGRVDFVGGNKKDMIRSLELIQSYEPRYILPGHGRIFEGKEGIRALFDKAIAIHER